MPRKKKNPYEGFTYSPEAFDEKVKSYCLRVGKTASGAQKDFPDESGMLMDLGISDEEYELCKKTEPYASSCLWALRCRKSWLERQSASVKSAAAGCFNLMKQPQNGGYSDKPVETEEKQFVIKLQGVDI